MNVPHTWGTFVQYDHLLEEVNYEAERTILAKSFQWAKLSKTVHFHTSINYYSLASTITQESGFIYCLHECDP